jgi:HSP20 family molecular chaperone IbpA
MFPWNLFPFNENMKKMINQIKPDQIDKYTQEMIEKMIPKNMEGMMNPENMFKGVFPGSLSHSNSIQHTVYDTHEHVFVRIGIKNEEWLNMMKVHYTANQLVIEHIPDFDDKHTLTLPAIVKKKGVTANYKDGTLEFMFPKSTDMQFCEIDISGNQ